LDDSSVFLFEIFPIQEFINVTCLSLSWVFDDVQVIINYLSECTSIVNLITYLMSLIVYREVKTGLVIKNKNSRNPIDRFTAV